MLVLRGCKKTITAFLKAVQNLQHIPESGAKQAPQKLTARISKRVKIFNFDRFPKESGMERSAMELSFGNFEILFKSAVSR